MVSSSQIDALAVVVSHKVSNELQALRDENSRLKSALESVQNAVADDSQYYFNLVWIARGLEGDDRENNSQVLAEIRSMGREDRFVLDLENMSGDGGDWFHGFNSGMLAASRMYHGLANSTEDIPCIYGSVFTMKQQRDRAINEFPMLDT